MAEEERRSYDQQIGGLQVTVGALKENVNSLKESFEDFRGEQREYNAAVIERLDNKINGKIDTQGVIINQHGVAIAALIAEVKNIKENTPIQLPVPAPGTKTTVEVSESDKPLTRGDLKIVVATLLAGGTVLGLLFKYGPALMKAIETGTR